MKSYDFIEYRNKLNNIMVTNNLTPNPPTPTNIVSNINQKSILRIWDWVYGSGKPSITLPAPGHQVFPGTPTTPYSLVSFTKTFTSKLNTN